MNTKEGILSLFQLDKSQKEIIDTYSRKSYFRYLKLWLLMLLRDRVQFLIDSDGWDAVNLPEVRVTLNRVRKW